MTVEKVRPHKLVLHVGCGPYQAKKLHTTFHTDEWQELRLDIDPGVKPDIVANITNMSRVGTASVDAVWSSHNLEHLFAHEVPIALKEFCRVLKPGGFALITLPDLQRATEAISQGKLEETLYTSGSGPIAALDVLYGHRRSIQAGNQYMAHRTGFIADTLKKKLLEAGFERVTVDRAKVDLWAKGYKRATAVSPASRAARLKPERP